jgi:hypothetical protein
VSTGKRRNRNRYHGNPTEAAQARLVDHVLGAAGAGVSREQAQRLLERAGAWTFVPMRQLDRYLATHPEAFTAADPLAPRALLRLLLTLQEAGFGTAVRLPGCAGCGRATRDLVLHGRPHPDGIGRCCQACMSKIEKIVCARCGRTGTRQARRADGVICRVCYDREPQRQPPCIGCGRARTPTRRTEDGQPLCQGCAPRPVHRCVGCGMSAPTQAITAAGRVCRRCYRQPERVCGGCGRARTISYRGDGVRPDLCASCVERPVSPCDVCGRYRRCKRGADGRQRCQGCSPRPLRACAICAQQRTTQAFWPLGPVCPACYWRSISRHGQCDVCQQTRVLVDRNAAGVGLCGRCATNLLDADGTSTVRQANIDYRCRSCGAGGDLYAAGRCSRCVLTDRVTDLLSWDDGTIRPELLPLAVALTNAPAPRHTLSWLGGQPSARLLADLARGADPITHDQLDRLAATVHRGTVGHLRKLLVTTTVLPDRIEPLAQLEPWLDQQLAAHPAEHQRLVRQFAQWVVLRKARRDAARGRYTHASASNDREQIRHARLLLTWLHDCGLAINDLTQAHLDAWLLDGSHQRRQVIRAFVTWTAARRLTPELEVARQRHDEPTRFLAEEHHLDLLHRCMSGGDAMSIDVKVAGALILLYGVRLTRIHNLTTDRITTTGERSYITFDTNPVLLPPNLARHIDSLITQPSRTATTFQPPRGPRPAYLFPGRPPTLPMHPTTLGTRLRHHGIPVAAGRNSALISLAADLPAPIIADLFGLHPSTAAAWSSYARTDWSEYIASRPTIRR